MEFGGDFALKRRSSVLSGRRVGVEVVYWAELKSTRDVWLFVGLVMYFRKYVPNFALRVDALYKTLRKSAMLSSSPVIRLYLVGSGVGLISLVHNSSLLGWGAWVSEEDERGDRYVVAFFLGRFQAQEKGYDQHQFEVLGCL